MFHVISQALGGDPENWTDAFAWIAWRLGSPDALEGFRARASSTRFSNAERKRMMDAVAFVKSPEAAMTMLDLASSTNFPAQAGAMWWVFNRKNNDWSEYGLDAALKERGLYDPDKIQLAEVLMPEPPAQPSKLPPVAEILKLRGNAARGKSAAIVCLTCHQIGGAGTDFGPDLTMFGKTQTREVVLNSLINPSAEISHGYDGSELIATDGTTIHGMVLANGDPVIIKSMAGQIQTVPKNRVKSLRRLNRSLMFSADMLGLNPQALADIAEYLQAVEPR
jgi:putative heme-binding domain-containing protein